MEKEKPDILFLPTWYPNRDDSMIGLFTQKHADILQDKVNVFVVAIIESVSNKERFEIETSSERGYTELKIYYKKNNIAVLSKIINPLNKLTAFLLVKKILKNLDFKPDLVHLHTASSLGLLALYFKKIKKVNYVITEHWSRYLAENDSFKGYFTKKFIKHLVRNASAMSSVSEYLKDAMLKHGLSNSNWRIIPNIIDHRTFKPVDISGSKTKKRIFHISCFEDKSKNISGILEAVKVLSTKRKDFELIMIGDGVDFQMLKNKAYNKLKIEKDILKFTGEVSDQNELVDIINSCDFSVLYSNYETFGIVIPESLACEKPVIGSDGGAIPEILPEKYGLIIEKDNISKLTQAINYMLDNYNKYPKEEMRDYVIENYSSDYVAHKIFEMYKSILTDV